MNSQVTLKDVANAVGLSETTVSLVVNGKAARRGITPATQARVTAAIRQLGYQPDLVNRTIALHQAVPRATAQPDGISNGRFQIAETEPIGRQIGLVLSTTSQTNTVALIPGVEQTFTEAGYRLNIAVTPADPASARERIGQLLREGPAGILACPSVYAVATATVAEACPEPSRMTCPVIVLWQDAAKAMLTKLGVRSAERGMAATTVLTTGTAPAAIPTPATPAPHPIVTPTETPTTPGAIPVRPVTPIPVPVPSPSKPPPIIVETRPQAPTITHGTTPIETPQAQEPAIATPNPVFADTTPATPAPTPKPAIEVTSPVSPPMEEVSESPTLEPEPVSVPEPETPPEPVPTPVTELVMTEEPIIEPTPEPVIIETPTPEPVFEEKPLTTPSPEPVPSPVIVPEPIVTPPIAEIPPPAPPHLEPISVIPVIPEPSAQAVIAGKPDPTGDTQPMIAEEFGRAIN